MEKNVQQVYHYRKSSPVTIIVNIILIGALAVGSFYLGYKYNRVVDLILDAVKGESGETVEFSDNIDILFQDAVLGEARENSELIVYEQDIQKTTTIQENGAFDWSIFSKNKNVTYCGTALYTVEFKVFTQSDILVDKENKTVKIYVPRAQLNSVRIDPDDIILGETQNGFLAFGEIKFTLEQAFELENQAHSSLTELAGGKEYLDKADQAAQKAIYDLFAKVIRTVDSDYQLIIELY